jgi:hypothetical protein
MAWLFSRQHSVSHSNLALGVIGTKIYTVYHEQADFV